MRFHYFSITLTTQAKIIMKRRASQIPFPATIEPDCDDEVLLRRRRFKKICSTHPPNYSPIPRPPSAVSGGLQHPANLQSSIARTVITVQKQCPKEKDCIETEGSSSNVMIKRKRASSTSPQNTMMMPLEKPRLPFYIPRKLPSSARRILLPLGRPLAFAPSLPTRLVTGRAMPKLSLV